MNCKEKDVQKKIGGSRNVTMRVKRKDRRNQRKLKKKKFNEST
jgi:hypothetical protein